MKILTDHQIKEADIFTMEHEPINSLLLMERASQAIAGWIAENIDHDQPLLFVIGRGDNGGDGLVAARILYEAGYDCTVFIVFDVKVMNENCLMNYQRLPPEIKYISNVDEIKAKDYIIIDALLGSGVKGEVKEPVLSVIETINALPNKVFSIDLPSGLKPEFGNSISNAIIHADVTLSLEFPRLALLLPEAGECCGKIVLQYIKLDHRYMDMVHSPYYYVTSDFIDGIRLKRTKFAHKNTYGHTLLICGSQNKLGAAILATGAALRSGCGLVTLHIPASERLAVQSTFPSAMLSLDSNTCFSQLPDNLSVYAAIGIGCGLGQSEETIEAFSMLLSKAERPMLFDADALNILSKKRELLKFIPKGSVLTPHPGELKKLVGEWRDEEHKLHLTSTLSKHLESIVVLKGAHTMICTPDGQFYFNSTGNSGMAKGGSGDVLAGYITGLMARGYSGEQAAILGVYNHGLAGDAAALQYGEEAMNSKDLIDFLE